MLALHATLSWLLIPRFGPIAPALSMILAEFLLTILCLFALRPGRPTAAALVNQPDDVPDTLPA